MKNSFVKENYLKWVYMSWWFKTANHQAIFSLQQIGSEETQSCSSQVLTFFSKKQREIQSFFYIWSL